MALRSNRISGGGRRIVLRLGALCLGALFALAAPAMAEAACVAAAINGKGKQISGTRSITHGIFPRKVCRRALRHCERRLDELRYETGRRRPFARCEIVASGPRAGEIFGPPLEGWRVDPDERAPGHPDDYAYRDEPGYSGDGGYDRPHDRSYDAPPDDFGSPGAHDGWRSAERDYRYDAPEARRYDERDQDRPQYEGRRYDGPPAVEERDYQGGDPLIDDLLRDENAAGAPPPTGRHTPYDDGREARSCNIAACEARYKTFRPSDCTYKPTLYERRRCPL